jgi:preprotein translocase subunit SecE
MADEDSRANERAQTTGGSGGGVPSGPSGGGGGGGGGTAAARSPRGGGGFFTIYKRGQGYWTRMGTALGAAFIAALTADFVYVQMKAIPYSTDAAGQPLYIAKSVCAGVALAVLATILFFAWRAMNKPSNADFLIATDSEMKKVNWTTRKELIGSTRVVIFFVILISALLFLLDVVFGYFFHLIKVLEFGPFQ